MDIEIRAALPCDVDAAVPLLYSSGQYEAIVQAVIALVVAFGLNFAPDQIGAILGRPWPPRPGHERRRRPPWSAPTEQRWPQGGCWSRDEAAPS